MPDQTTNQGPLAAPTLADLTGTVQTLAAAMAQSFTDLNQRDSAANTTLIALTIILAAMQETAALRPERLAAVSGVMLRDRPDLQKEVATVITGIVNTSRGMSDAIASVAAQAAADRAKAGGAKPN